MSRAPGNKRSTAIRERDRSVRRGATGVGAAESAESAEANERRNDPETGNKIIATLRDP